jgi:hypothetical protein
MIKRKRLDINLHYPLTSAAILSAVASIFQSAGGFLPVMGLFISPFATLPIILVTMISIPHGIMSYFTTIFLLTLIQPSELFIFPFTTGLLGLTVGAGYKYFRNNITTIISSGLVLVLGILILLYVIQFPILGPSVPISFRWEIVLILIPPCCLYAWIWVVFIRRIMKRKILFYIERMMK